MPGDFLTDAQAQAYGHFVGPPSKQQLSRYFHLDDADRQRIYVRRGAHNKLGFSLQRPAFASWAPSWPNRRPSLSTWSRMSPPNSASATSRVWRITPHVPPRRGNTPQRFVTSMVIATLVIRVLRSASCAGCISVRG